jgi:hypothetical protein
MNKRVLNLIVLFAFLLLSATAYSQAVTMTTATADWQGQHNLAALQTSLFLVFSLTRLQVEEIQ